MPYVKQISIHKSPQNFLEYILNGDKNSDMKYASGINVTPTVSDAYNEMKMNFEMNTGENFYKATINETKEKIRVHHYIQSFDPSEKISPEQAHKIGLEWAKKAFGNNRQIVCSTHLDKGHIHNHFAISPYDFKGNLWHSNKKSLNEIRNISDEICKENNIKIIDSTKKNPYKFSDYKEWTEAQNDTSWKENLRRKIDSLILLDDVNSVSNLCSKLADENYKITRGKYISIRPPGREKGIRTFRLGDGYSEEDLLFRIQNKDKEISIEAIQNRYIGIQIDYAFTLRNMQINVYQKLDNSHKYTHKRLRETSENLLYLSKNNISSIDVLQDKLSELNDKFAKKNAEISSEKKSLNELKKLYSDGQIFYEISKKLPNISDEEKKEYLRTEYVLKRGIRTENDVGNLLNEIENSNKKQGDLSEEIKLISEKKSRIESIIRTLNDSKKDDFDKIKEQIIAEKEEQQIQYKNNNKENVL